MTITIGGREFATSRPDGIDALLARATGCTAAEHVRMLGKPSTPFQVARALQPMLDGADAPTVADLSAMIEADNVDAIRRATIALLEPEPSEQDGEA